MPDIAATRPVAGQPIETAWGQQVHDTIEGTRRVYAATGGLDISGGAAMTLYCTVPITPPMNAPCVVASVIDPNAQNFIVGVVEVLAGSAKIGVRMIDGAPFAYALSVQVIAVENG